ncbi:hypothetical protein BC830DRAFT_1073465, partial [Chytriomyces sp. MP71]
MSPFWQIQRRAFDTVYWFASDSGVDVTPPTSPVTAVGPTSLPAPPTDSTSTPRALHRVKQSSMRSKSFACIHCGKSCFRKQDLERHVVTHTKTKSFACAFGCGAAFGRNDALGRHMR